LFALFVGHGLGINGLCHKASPHQGDEELWALPSKV
jgi:hypothetical protein